MNESKRCAYCGAEDNGTCAYPSEDKPGCLLPAHRIRMRELLKRATECMSWAEMPLQEAIRRTRPLRAAGEPPPNVDIRWVTHWDSAREFLTVLNEMRQHPGAFTPELESAVDCLQEIAALSRKLGSEIAGNWLQQHGYPREPGGYVPGKGFVSALDRVLVRGGLICFGCGRTHPGYDPDKKAEKWQRDVEGHWFCSGCTAA